jgi:hypothetical protein
MDLERNMSVFGCFLQVELGNLTILDELLTIKFGFLQVKFESLANHVRYLINGLELPF